MLFQPFFADTPDTGLPIGAEENTEQFCQKTLLKYCQETFECFDALVFKLATGWGKFVLKIRFGAAALRASAANL